MSIVHLLGQIWYFIKFHNFIKSLSKLIIIIYYFFLILPYIFINGSITQKLVQQNERFQYQRKCLRGKAIAFGLNVNFRQTLTAESKVNLTLCMLGNF